MERELPASLLMFIASRSAANRIFEALQERGFDDVTIAQARLMMGVDPEGTRLSVLAARAQIAKQTATALVDKLERAGYVERVADPPRPSRGGPHRTGVARTSRHQAHAATTRSPHRPTNDH